MMHEGIMGFKRRAKGIAKAALALSMCLVMPFTSIAASASAAAAPAEEFPDLDRAGSISVKYTYYNEKTGETLPVTGGNSVGLYKVADVVVDNGYKFVTDSRFAEAGEIPATSEELDSANRELAAEMAAIAKSYDFDVASQEMDANGEVSFSNLGVGLYLVMQDKQGTGEYKMTISPFLISIPQNHNGTLVYDVDAEAKPTNVTRNDEKIVPPPEPTPHDPPRRLPQTGQLWWPVMIMGGLGALFVGFGMVRKNKNK